MPDQQNQNNKSGIASWLADHPWLKFAGAVVAIVGGITSIISFTTGVGSLPELTSLWTGNYYDRFEQSSYDGKFDPSLWKRSGNSGVLVEQRDGALVIQPVNVTEEGGIELVPIKSHPIPFDEFYAMEAKLKRGSNAQGTGFIKTLAFSYVNGSPWWIECQLTSPRPGSVEYFCNVEEGEFNGATPVYAYETKRIPVEFDKWYRSRFEITDNTVKFYLDYRLIDEYTFSYSDALHYTSLEFHIGSWVGKTDQFIGYFDDIRIDRKP